MSFIEWKEEYSVGVFIIDEQHKKLIDVINALHDVHDKKEATQLVRKAVVDLRDYVNTHFTTEEEILRIYKYPGYEKHLVEHADFRNKVESLYNDMQEADMDVPMFILKFLMTWLTSHIQKIDKGFGPYLNSKGLM